MSSSVSQKNNKHVIHVLYLLGFLSYLHFALPNYIHSSFLGQFMSEARVGTVFTIGALLMLILFFAVPLIIARFGNFKTTICVGVLNLGATLALAFVQTPYLIVGFMVVHFAIVRILLFNLDIFLEHVSSDAQTGRIRGIFITSANIGVLISPLIAGFVVGADLYWRIYLLSALMLIPIITILLTQIKNNYHDARYRRVKPLQTLRTIYKNKNVYKILGCNFLLYAFFAIMVIYTPLYLHDHIGFAWNTIGIIFTIMLLPFVLLEFVLGRLADTTWGEKEMLSIGFVIMALTTALLSFITTPNVVLWTALLFATRIGASMVEIMNETYFFKQINDSDSGIISAFRTARPVAYLFAPLLGSAVIALFDIRFIFLAIGIVLLAGLRYSLTLRDTR